MNTGSILLLMTTLANGTALAGTVNFDDAKPGEPPPGWTATQTGSGKARWTIEKDDTAPGKSNVLKQSGEAKYPVCLKNDTSLKDGFVEVKFKLVAGKEDQAGGVVWRARDADNYFIARANALEDNVTLSALVQTPTLPASGKLPSVASRTFFPSNVTMNVYPAKSTRKVCHTPDTTLVSKFLKATRVPLIVW